MPKLKPDVQRPGASTSSMRRSRCFARTGFHRTSIRDICREAGVSPGAFYVYFDSKEALIAGIAEGDRAEFAERLAMLATHRTFSRRCVGWASTIFSMIRSTAPHVHRHRSGVDPQSACRRDTSALRPLHPGKLPNAVPEAQGRGAHRTRARRRDGGAKPSWSFPTACSGAVRSIRRSIRWRCHAGRAAARLGAPEAGAWAGRCVQQQ